MKKQILSLAAAAAVITAASSSFAALVPGDADLSVSMDITSTCTVTVTSTALPATSGNVASVTAPASTGSIEVDCVGYPGVVLLNGGLQPTGTVNRNLAGPGADMAYTLTNNADSAEVGDNNSPDGAYGATTLNQPGITYSGAAVATYGIDAAVTVAAGQAVGTYADTVGVTLAL